MEKELAKVAQSLRGARLSIQRNLPTYKGRKIGLVILTIAQLLIGAIHVFFGALLLAFENFAFVQATFIYTLYTLIFGL